MIEYIKELELIGKVSQLINWKVSKKYIKQN